MILTTNLHAFISLTNEQILWSLKTNLITIQNEKKNIAMY